MCWGETKHALQDLRIAEQFGKLPEDLQFLKSVPAMSINAPLGFRNVRLSDDAVSMIACVAVALTLPVVAQVPIGSWHASGVPLDLGGGRGPWQCRRFYTYGQGRTLFDFVQSNRDEPKWKC